MRFKIDENVMFGRDKNEAKKHCDTICVGGFSHENELFYWLEIIAQVLSLFSVVSRVRGEKLYGSL